MRLFRGRYLNSFDHIAAYLNWRCRKTPAGGNDFIVQLACARPPEVEPLAELLNRNTRKLPFLFGKTRRNPWNLAQYRTRGTPREIPVTEMESGSGPETLLNRKMDACLPFLAAICGCDVFFRFRHTVFDGHGAELFLDRIFSGGDISPASGLLETPHLDDWKNQFACGTLLRRRILERAPGAATAAPDDAPMRFLSFGFSPEDTKRIEYNAERALGPFMILPHLFASAASAAAPLFRAKGLRGSLVLPVSVDQRGEEDQEPDALFFNHWSLMILRAEEKDSDNFGPALRKSFYENAGGKLPHAFRHAAFLTRIAPFPAMQIPERKFGGAVNGSFMASYLNSGSLAGRILPCGAEIVNVRHFPSMPPAPGLGVVFNFANGQLNGTVAYREGALTAAEAQKLCDSIIRNLEGART